MPGLIISVRIGLVSAALVHVLLDHLVFAATTVVHVFVNHLGTTAIHHILLTSVGVHSLVLCRSRSASLGAAT